MVTCSELCVSKKKGKNKFTSMLPLMSVSGVICMVLSDVLFNAGMFDSPVVDMMAPAMILIFCPSEARSVKSKVVVFPLLMAVLAFAVPSVRVFLMLKNMHEHIVPLAKCFPAFLALIMTVFIGVETVSSAGIPVMKQLNMAISFFLLLGAVYYMLCPGTALLFLLSALSLLFYVYLYVAAAWPAGKIQFGRRPAAARVPAAVRTPAEKGSNLSILYSRLQTLFEEEKPYLDENITVGQIAKKLYTNKAYLSRAINDYTGKNFCQFVNYHRIMYSMEIFKENPGYRVSELAEASGFHTIVSFNMAFRLVTNESPGEWCKRTRCGMEPKARRAE